MATATLVATFSVPLAPVFAASESVDLQIVERTSLSATFDGNSLALDAPTVTIDFGPEIEALGIDTLNVDVSPGSFGPGGQTGLEFQDPLIVSLDGFGTWNDLLYGLEVGSFVGISITGTGVDSTGDFSAQIGYDVTASTTDTAVITESNAFDASDPLGVPWEVSSCPAVDLSATSVDVPWGDTVLIEAPPGFFTTIPDLNDGIEYDSVGPVADFFIDEGGTILDFGLGPIFETSVGGAGSTLAVTLPRDLRELHARYALVDPDTAGSFADFRDDWPSRFEGDLDPYLRIGLFVGSASEEFGTYAYSPTTLRLNWAGITDTGDAAPAPPPEVDRISGADRFATSAQVANEFPPFADGEGVVYVANGFNYPDALSAAPAAAFRGAPLLLTQRDTLPSSVPAQIVRLSPELIVIAGGTGVVSTAVEAQLRSLAPQVERHAGADRYVTSRELTSQAFGDAGATTVFLATGRSFPDALAASAAAGRFDAPVILVDGTLNTVPLATRQLLDSLGAEQIYIAGGTGVVKDAIRTSLIAQGYAVTRLAGADRYATSVAINDFTFAQAPTVFLAVGTGCVDALGGAALAGRAGAPLFVVPPTCVPASVLAQLDTLNVAEVRLLGGPGALSARVAALISS